MQWAEINVWLRHAHPMVASKVPTRERSLRGGIHVSNSSFVLFLCTQIMPNDPDGLHLLGLSLYSQGMILRGASEGDGGSQGMQDHLMVAVPLTIASHRAHTTEFRERLGTWNKCCADENLHTMEITDTRWI